jgi:hypothetical protein
MSAVVHIILQQQRQIMSRSGGRKPGGEWAILLIVFLFCIIVTLLCVVFIR